MECPCLHEMAKRAEFRETERGQGAGDERYCLAGGQNLFRVMRVLETVAAVTA